MKKQHPILFSTPMVQAILDGRKTQTRRIVKAGFDLKDMTLYGLSEYNEKVGMQAYFINSADSGDISAGAFGTRFPFGKPGDILWVRETFYAGYVLDDNDKIGDDAPLNYWYFADTRDARPADMSDSHCYHLWGGDKKLWPRWKPSIHMPKEAARIWLLVTNVRVQCLHVIQEHQAIAEGVLKSEQGFYKDYFQSNDYPFDNATSSFATLWQTINGESGFGWDANPWVWVVEFKVLSTTGKPENI